MNKLKIFVINIIIPLAVGFISSSLTQNAMMKFDQFKKPLLSPPSFIFPIVWTILYILMGVGMALVLTSDASDAEKTNCVFLYALQLGFNFLWSILFFTYNAFLLSFIWLSVMLILIILMTAEFKKASPIAAYLQIPYILWVAFAGYLNFAIFLLN